MKKICTVDIESSGLLADMLDYSSFPYKLNNEAKLWCVVITDVHTLQSKTLIKEEITKEAVKEAISEYDIIVAHNGIKFDFPTLMLFGVFDYEIGWLGEEDTLFGKQVKFVDTLIMSRLANPDRLGGHGLEAWGERVGVQKTDYRGELIKIGAIDKSLPKGEEFKMFHPLLVPYCIQDTVSNVYTYGEILKEYKGYDTCSNALRQEHKLADLAVRRELVGFSFDRDLALENLTFLIDKMQELSDNVSPLLPKKPLTKGELADFTPPKTQLKADGSLSHHMVRFIERHNLKLVEKEGCVYYKETALSLPLTEPLETHREASIDDLDVVKEYLIELGWIPSEWKERDLSKDSKKQTITYEKKEKATKRYVQETLAGKYKKERLEIIGVKEQDLERTLLRRIREPKSVKVPTSPSVRVGVVKELCPHLIELGEKVSFAKDFSEYLTYKHRKSCIAGGDIEEMDFDSEIPNTGYLATVRTQDGRIPTPAIEIGASTNRYTHIGVVNVPRATSLFGKEMRSLFGCGEGYVQFGYDYASLEARIEAAYVYDYEGGEEMAHALLAEKPNDIHCYSQDTEILTTEGWKSFGAITTESEVAQYNPKNDNIEFVNPSEVVWQNYKGDMVNLKSSGTDQLITPNHRVIDFTKAGNPVVVEAIRYIPKKDRYFKASSICTNNKFYVHHDVLKLVVATQADGYLCKDCSAIQFSFTKRSKLDRLVSILEKLKADYSVRESLRKGRVEFIIRLNSSQLTKRVRTYLTAEKAFVKDLINLTNDCKEVFISEIGLWDGTIRKNKDIVLDQKCKESIDVVQGICSIYGIKTSVNTYKKNTIYGEVIIHRVYISLNSKPKIGTRNIINTIVPYEGFIGCVAVPSTFILVRRNGNTFISGNTVTANKLEIDRDAAKSTNYAMIYGASPNKFVKMLGYPLDKAKKFHGDWWDANPALKELKEDKEKEWIASGKKYITSIDGRRINIRSQHSILNALFQSAGVICAKYVTVKLFQKMQDLGYKWDCLKDDINFGEMISMHDEAQYITKKELLTFKRFNTKEEAETFKSEWTGEQLGAIQQGKNNKYYITLPSDISRSILTAIKEVEEMFNMKVSLGIEYVTGKTWYDCH